jgi:hypothetical protein
MARKPRKNIKADNSVSPRSLKSSFIKKIDLVLIGLLGGLIFVECIIRIFCPHPRYEYVDIADEMVGHIARPNYNGRASNRFAEYNVKLSINQEGFRDKDYTIEKPPDTLRIAFLGDSFTFGTQVEEEQTFVRRTETMLNQRLKEKGSSFSVQCMNFGMDGFEIQQYVQCYEAYVKKYKPDLVIANIYTGNDLLCNAFYLYERNFGRPYFRLKDNALEAVPVNKTLLAQNYEHYQKRNGLQWYHRSHLYNLQKLFFFNVREGRRFKEHQQQQLSLNDLWKEDGYRDYRYYVIGSNDPMVKEADLLSKLLLQRLQTSVEQYGGKLGIVLLPAWESLWPERWSERVKKLPGLENLKMDFDRPFREVNSYLPKLASHGLILDTRPELRKVEANGPIFFKYDGHYTQVGQEAVANAIAHWLDAQISRKNIDQK